MVEKIREGRPYLYDGSGVIGICNFCSRSDIVVPTGTLHLCPDCVKRGEWHHNRGRPVINQFGMQSRVRVLPGYARCDICGVLAVGYIMAVEGWVCFRCLWTKIAKRHDALRPEGFRLV